MLRSHESEEMYLETILVIKKRKGTVRSVDIVEELDYAKSSVSRGVGSLFCIKQLMTITSTGPVYCKIVAVPELV